MYLQKPKPLIIWNGGSTTNDLLIFFDLWWRLSEIVFYLPAGSVRVNGSVMNSGYPPHQQIPQAYGYHQMPARLDSTNPSQAMGGYTLQSQQAYAYANSKGSPDVAVNMRAPPFHLPAGPKNNNPLDRLATDTDIYTRSLNGIVAAATASVGAGAGAHRNVGVVPSGMSRMY
jgi:mitogen-activated protein kinase 1/3